MPELRRDASWRFSADPNPWDAPLAFDGSLVTRWKTWERARAGMYLQVEFGSFQTVSQVTVDTPEDSEGSMRVEGMAAVGGWMPLADQPAEHRIHPGDLRRGATAELKARGIGYLVVKARDVLAPDIASDPGRWGLELVGQALDTKVYRIE